MKQIFIKIGRILETRLAYHCITREINVFFYRLLLPKKKKKIISATLKHFESVFDHMFRLENLKATSILERYPSNIILRQILKEYVLQEFTSKVFFTLAEEASFKYCFPTYSLLTIFR